MAIVSRSCRLAGFYQPNLVLFLLLPLRTSPFLIFARTSSSFPSFPFPPREYSFSAAYSPLAGRPKARRVFLPKYSPVVISRKTPFFSPKTREILACTSIAGARGSRERFEDKRERASTSGNGAKGSGRGQKRRQESSSNVARREIASFPNPLCVFWLDWPPSLPVPLATSATPLWNAIQLWRQHPLLIDRALTSCHLDPIVFRKGLDKK